MPIRKIGNSWYADFYANGKRVRKKLSANKTTAQRIHNTLVSQEELASFGIVPDGYPLDKLKDDFLRELKPRITRRTFSNYETVIENAFNKMRDVELHTLRAQLGNYLQLRYDEGKSSAILNRTIGLFKRIIGFGIETKVIAFNPISDIKYFKVSRPQRRVLTTKEITDLLDHAKQYRTIWLTFLCTGLRHSELVNLTWDDVNLDKGMISVRGTKTCAAVRTIPISPGLKVELNKIPGKRESYVFKTGRGTQFKNNLLTRFLQTLERAGINPKGLNIHTMRHTFATLLASNNTHPKHIQALLGHRSALTSLDIYTKVYNEDLKLTIKKINIS